MLQKITINIVRRKTMNHDIVDIIALINVMHDKAVLLQRQMHDTPESAKNHVAIDNLMMDIKMMARQIAYEGTAVNK
jgi:hypothetical protein